MPKKISFKDCLKQRKAWYKTIKPVEAPILNENVIFNAKGFYHLKYDGQGKRRSIKEYHKKLWYLPLASLVIEKATSVHDYKPRQYSKLLGKYFEIWELSENVKISEITGSKS